VNNGGGDGFEIGLHCLQDGCRVIHEYEKSEK